MYSEETINRVVQCFTDLTKEILLDSINQGKDLYSAISELTGIDRQRIKTLLYGIMYST